jgi:hypothetical protein
LSSTFDVTETDDQRTIPIIDEANEILESTPASIMGDDHVDLGNSDLASVTDPSVDAAVALSRRELRRRRRENLKAERAAARTEAIKLRVAEQAPVDSAEHLPTPEHDIAEATATAATPTETFAAVDPIAADDPRSVYEPVATDEPFAADDTFVTDHTVAGDGTEVAASPVSELADPARTLVNSDPVTTDSVAPQTVVSGPATIDHDPVPAADDTDDVLEIRDFAATRNTTENEAPPADSAPLPAAPLPRLDATQLRGSLLENVPEEFRTQIESWLRDIGPETLERITAEDIDRAVRILEDETDDENLEHLRDVIRERPPVRITFAEPTAPQETAAPAFDTTSAEPELRRESSLLSVFSRTGREERREQRTRAKIAREQVRLERTRVKSERRQSLREERQRRREERDESKIQRSLARVQGLSLRERIAQSRMQRQTSRALRSEFREREQLRIRELRAAERTLKSEAKQGKRAAAKTEKSQRSLERREEREIKRTQRDLQRDEKKLDRSDRSEFKESSRSRSREERRVEKARSRSLRSDEKEARRLEKARTDEETAARKAVVDGEAAKLRSEAAQTRQQVRSIRRLERESGRLSRIQEKARKRAEKSDVKAQRSAERARKRELAKQEMEAKAALTRERMLAKESEKITKRAARVEKLSRGGLSSSSTILPAPGGRYDWNTEAGFLGGAAVGEDIDPAAFDLPEGLPSRTR